MALVNCPVELLKVTMQTSKAGYYKNLFSCCRTIVATRGIFNGLFRGQVITILRDAPSFIAYFMVYERLRELDYNPVVSGATAGVSAWLPCYPQDVIKSVIQSSPQRLSIGEAARSIYSQGGWRGFWRGFTPTMARAVPANAATFMAYEVCKSLMLSNTNEKSFS
jgi:solute carrier family 25 carnitine/acylcarnitine transporter 20/29